MSFKLSLVILSFVCCFSSVVCAEVRGTGDLGLVIEREQGSVLLIETSHRSILKRIEGLGDLSHASVVFSRDQRFAYVFGRDGGLSKVDLLTGELVKRVVQAGNSIGGAISQDGGVIAVSNYTPGGIKLFSADTLELLADIPTGDGQSRQGSKVVGLVDAPGQKFVCSLFEGNQIWLIDAKEPRHPKIVRYEEIGSQPYDGLITPEGHFYLAGLFGEKGLAMLDLWKPESGVTHILSDYGKEDDQLPVYKMPHLEGWTVAGDLLVVPAVGQHEVLVIDRRNWNLVERIPVAGQPVFVVSRPDARQVWVNFAFPDNHLVQVIDMMDLKVINTLHPGKAVLHLEFTPRGEAVWMAVRDDDKVMIYDTETLQLQSFLDAHKPSGVFFTQRSARIGQ